MKFTLEDTYNDFKNQLEKKLVGKRVYINNAPTDKSDDLNHHLGVVKSVELFTDTYDCTATSEIFFEDGKSIYVDEDTPIEIV